MDGIRAPEDAVIDSGTQRNVVTLPGVTVILESLRNRVWEYLFRFHGYVL